MMKKTIKFLSVIVAFVSIHFCIHAQEINIEDDNLSMVPTKFLNLLRSFDSDYSDCDYIGTTIVLDNNPQTTYWFLTTKDACGWGTALGPIWLLSETDSHYCIILSDGGYSLSIERTKSNGLFDIKITSGTSGWLQEDQWRYDGNKYKKVNLKDTSKN